ncbi:hypothetical protein [Nocardioides sp. LHG3406-4]|uniref:hypothetical protein n=1 Tax=Nocardioides sp. LHG3406-4 TaxID=2804575 RepID=UPI003CF065EB
MLELFAETAWKVVLAGLVLCAGLPALFTLGVRFSAAGSDASGGTATAVRGGQRALGVLCFLAVAAGVALGITVVGASGFGQAVSFDHVYPTLVTAD